jgi:hypothetical protein
MEFIIKQLNNYIENVCLVNAVCEIEDDAHPESSAKKY